MDIRRHRQGIKLQTTQATPVYFKAKHDEEQLLLALDQGVGELEVDLLAGELLVDAGEGVSLVLDVGLLGLVQVDLEQTRTVQADPVTMATVKT